MITVFYANKVFGHYKDWFELRREIHKESINEIYQGGYAYDPKFNAWNQSVWYRMDGTPVLDEDVPPQLKAWVLLLED